MRDLRSLVASMLSVVASIRTPHTSLSGFFYYFCAFVLWDWIVSARDGSCCGGEIVIVVGRRDIMAPFGLLNFG